MLKKLWADEGGAIISAELILIMTILVIGLIVGLKALQDAVVTELGDVGAAIGAMNQSYATSGNQVCGDAPEGLGGCAWSAGSRFDDELDQCETAGPQTAGGNSLGIVVCGIVAPGEGS